MISHSLFSILICVLFLLPLSFYWLCCKFLLQHGLLWEEKKKLINMKYFKINTKVCVHTHFHHITCIYFYHVTCIHIFTTLYRHTPVIILTQTFLLTSMPVHTLYAQTCLHVHVYTHIHTHS